MNRIINNIQFKRNLTYMLNKQKCNTTFRFSKYTNMLFFLVAHCLQKSTNQSIMSITKTKLCLRLSIH